MDNEEKEIDKWIAKVQNSMNDLAQSEENQNYTYITKEDVEKLGNSTASNEEGEPNNLLLVVKAPKGTTLEVPDIEDEEE